MLISDWSSDVCSSDLASFIGIGLQPGRRARSVRSAQPQHQLVLDVQQPLRSVAVRHQRTRREVHDVRIRHVLHARLRLASGRPAAHVRRSAEHTSELQSLMRISYAVFCLTKKQRKNRTYKTHNPTT